MILHGKMVNMKSQKRHLSTLKLALSSLAYLLMDGGDEERDLGLDNREETDEEVIHRVSQTT